MFYKMDQGNYFNSYGESNEYLVNKQELKRVASEYGLVPVYINFFEPIPGKNSFTTSDDFISFEQIYNLPKHGNWKLKELSIEEITISNLYTTFIFLKV